MDGRSHGARFITLVLVALLVLANGPAAFAVQATPETSSPQASPVASPVSGQDTIDLDVLFIGAHPDDEAWALSSYGQWNEYHDVNVGVITITRGEGGGNAVGTEEGPALGLLREAEERTAVGMAGIEHVYNLDEVDFFYTVSAEQTEETWGYDETLERVVRVVRATQPEIIVTMNPAPTPGNHGHHQLAARLAVDAYYSSGMSDVFPEQIDQEGLVAWDPLRIFRAGFSGESLPGENCGSTFTAQEPTDVVYGVWDGVVSEANDGRTWAAIERDGQRTYASQGWAVFPDAATDPAEIGCDFFTLLDSRAPFDRTAVGPTSPLDGAVLPQDGGLPLGSQFYITTDQFTVMPDQAFEATVHLVGTGVDAPEVDLVGPDGWSVTPTGSGIVPGGDNALRFEVVPSADAALGERQTLDATLSGDGVDVSASTVVEVGAPLTADIEPLPEVAHFREWVELIGEPQLDNLIFPVIAMGVGETRDVNVTVTNHTDTAASGTVEVTLPTGFSAESTSIEVADVPAQGSVDIALTLTNDDTALATSNEAGEEGSGFYPLTVTTTLDGQNDVSEAGINLVPSAVAPVAATAPTLDGEISEGEYTGEPVDLSRVWEGQPVDSPEDGSGQAYITHDEEGIYIAIEVTDETRGTVLPANDAKRHWRTDSVEIAIDPLGTGANTSSTYKIGVFPTTEEGEPAASRDADAHQGPIDETSPGLEVASSVSEPYTGYTIEVFIPYADLPADIDPENAAMNIFIYDSDTQDLTGQTRLGWSTYGGVQGDPYRWGRVTFEGYTGPTERTSADEAIMPLDAAQSAHSPQSIRQSLEDGVPIGGHRALPEGEGVTITDSAADGGSVKVTLSSTVNGEVFVGSILDDQIGPSETATVTAGETTEVTVEVADGAAVLVSFVDEDGRVQVLDATP